MENKSRLIIAAFFDADLPGGGNEYSIDLAREWLQRGFNVHVLASTFKRNLGDLETYAEQNRLTVHPISDVANIQFAHRFEPEVAMAARKIMASVQPDSIHIHNFHGLLGALWAAVESGYKTLYTALDLGLLCLSWYLYDGSSTPCSGPAARKCRDCLLRQHSVPWSKRLAARLPAFFFKAVGADPVYHKQQARLNSYYNDADLHLERLLPLLNRFDGMMTISPVTGRIFRECGVSPDKIFFHVQGLNHVAERAHISLKAGPLRLMFLGHMAPIKGLDVVARALREMPSSLELEINVYGPAARRFVRRQPWSIRRFFVQRDFLKGYEVEKELIANDGVIIPSLWHENTPYAVLRALAVGRPVVASRQEGITHLIRHRENGWLIPAGDVEAWRDALVDMASDPSRLRKLRNGCSFEKTVQQHADEIEKVVAAL